MRRKLLCAIFSAAFALMLSCISSVSADTRLVDTHEGLYAGEVVTLENVAQFVREVDLSGGINTPLIEFIITPSVRGSGSFVQVGSDKSLYTPDFEQLILTFKEKDTSKELKVQLTPRYNDNDYSIAVTAAGNNQVLAGEQLNNSSLLTTSFSCPLPYSFDAYSRSSQANRYMYSDGSYAKDGDNGAIRLYYDKTENALYTDTGYSGSTSRIGAAGNYRWRVRDFDFDGYIDPTNTLKADTLWEGFGEGKIEIRLQFDKVIPGKSPSIVVTAVGGLPAANPLVVEAPSMGLVDISYRIPKPIYYDYSSKIAYDFIEKGGKYSIKAPDGTTFLNETEFETDSRFTPSTVGDYKIIYKVDDITKELIIEVIEENEGTVIIPSSKGGEEYLNETVNVGAKVYNNMQKEKPAVSLTIKRNGTVIVPAFSIGENYNYTFTDDGIYEFIYTSTDYLEQVTEKTVTYNIKRFYTIWAEGISYQMLYGSAAEVQLPAPSDIIIYDVKTKAYINHMNCEILVSYNGGEYKALLQSSFVQYGDYAIKYIIRHYLDEIIQFESVRYISVYNNLGIEAITIDNVPINTKLLNSDLSDSIVKLKAVKGVKIIFPYGFFKSDSDILIELFEGNSKTNVTTDFMSGEYEFTPSQTGIYIFIASLTQGEYKTVKAISIDVRPKWYVAEDKEDITVPIGYIATGIMPRIYDWYGNLIEGGKAEIYYNETKIGGEGTLLDKMGIYTVIYSFSNEGETVTGLYRINSVDSTSPMVTLENMIEKARVNQFVKLADYTVTDDSGLNVEVLLTVTYNGKKINLFNGGFKPKEAGEYVVTLTARDAFGKTSVRQYTISVLPSLVLPLIILGGAGVLTIGGAVSFILIKRRKHR